MKYAHLIKFTVFSYENEDSDSIVKAFLSFFPFSLEDNKVSLNKTKATGFNEKKIRIFEITLIKHLDFFLRFEKDLWINEKKLVLTDSGKCFHIKISIAAFPKKRGIALNVIRDLFSGK